MKFPRCWTRHFSCLVLTLPLAENTLCDYFKPFHGRITYFTGEKKSPDPFISLFPHRIKSECMIVLGLWVLNPCDTLLLNTVIGRGLWPSYIHDTNAAWYFAEPKCLCKSVTTRLPSTLLRVYVLHQSWRTRSFEETEWHMPCLIPATPNRVIKSILWENLSAYPGLIFISLLVTSAALERYTKI